MDLLNRIVEIIYLSISVLGTVVVIWGVAEAIRSFILSKFYSDSKKHICDDNVIRQRLGAHLLLGLEIFIAADIISSVVSPNWQKIGMLAAIVGIRTVLSYFLSKEMKQA
jgi:uncharacterized membrane protein